MSVNNPQRSSSRHQLQTNTTHPYLYVVKDRGEISNWKDELSHWFDPINFYVYLWQPVRLQNHLLSRHSFFRKAFQLPPFNSLWNNICKGSFAYNTFLFRKPALSKNYRNSFLADLTCLALLFGDEFIDGICNEIGKSKMKELLKENGKTFYLHINIQRSGYPELEYGFDLYKLMSDPVWQIKNEKYGINYLEFYEMLKDLLCLMNLRLRKMNKSIAINAAMKIKDACDHCFDTFIHDVEDTPVQLYYKGNTPPTTWHEKKNRSIQLKLLRLRCVLLDRSIRFYAQRFAGWLDIISTMQVYDDMQDCRTDDEFQDNLLLSFASGNFPNEIKWFHENKKNKCNEHEWRMNVSQYMPCSAYLCTKFTKENMMQNMSWVQKKICNYLWKNNWFIPGNESEKNNNAAKKFHELLNKTYPVFVMTKSETEWMSYSLEIAFHDKQLRRYILLHASFMDRYFLYFNFLQMSSFEKTSIVKKIIFHSS